MGEVDVKVQITVIPPATPAGRGGRSRVLLPTAPEQPPLVRQRRLPAQPAEVPPGYVWVGADDGLVPYSGVKPRPGDLIGIVGSGTRRFVMSPLAKEPLRWPTFPQGCRCRCPARAGTAFFLSKAGLVANLLAIDADTGDLLQVFGMADLGFFSQILAGMGPSIACDDANPFDLYVLDDLRTHATWRTDAEPLNARRYFVLVHYTFTGGQYEPSSRYDLIDPYVRGSESDPLTLLPAQEPNSPAVPGNCLSVMDGVAHITLRDAPPRYLSIEDDAETEHALTGDVDSGMALLGNIVRVHDKPGRAAERYVLATDVDTNEFELWRFNASDVVTKRVALGSYVGLAPVQLAVSCNQIYVLIGEQIGFIQG